MFIAEEISAKDKESIEVYCNNIYKEFELRKIKETIDMCERQLLLEEDLFEIE